MALGKFYGVGIGPGDPRHMSLRAAEVLREADIVFTVVSPNAAYSVSGAAVAALAPLRGEVRVLQFSMSRDEAVRFATIEENARLISRELASGRACVFATIGDVMTYSTFGYILERVRNVLPGLEVEIVPGINSFSMLASASGKVLVEDDETLRVIPAFKSEMVDELAFEPGSTTVLLKTYHSRAALLERLEREPDIDIVYGERLGLDGEFLTTDLECIKERPSTYLSLLIVRKHRSDHASTL